MKNKNTNYPKFNLLDIVITMVFFAVVAVGAIYFLKGGFSFSNNTATSKTTRIEYVVTLDTVNEVFHDCVKIGDEAVDLTRSTVLGDVMDIRYSPATYTALNQQTGELGLFTYPDHEKVEITLSTKATYKNGVYYIGENKINVGSKVSMRVPGFIGVGFCTHIDILK